MLNHHKLRRATANGKSPEVFHHAHHIQDEFCTTRATYRQGKELKAVKVFTVSSESKHLLIQNIPSIKLLDEVKHLVAKFGKVETVKFLPYYPSEEFTNAFYVKYKHFRDARQAKKKLDNRSFFGNLLHVCYAPELETVDECRQKIQERIAIVRKKYGNPGPAHKGSHNSQSSGEKLKSTPATGLWANLMTSTVSSTSVRGTTYNTN